MAYREKTGIKKQPNATTCVTKFAIPLTMTTKIKELLQALPEALLVEDLLVVALLVCKYTTVITMKQEMQQLEKMQRLQEQQVYICSAVSVVHAQQSLA